MSLVQDQKRLTIIEAVANETIPPQSLPGIDISPLIDALVQFLLQMLEDCPAADIRRAAEQSAKRPVIRLFWRMRLAARMPNEVRAKCPDAPANLLEIGAKLAPADWARLESERVREP